MILWKCCTQYASKFGKLSSGRKTWKGQFSFQTQRKAMPKNPQITAQLHSSRVAQRLKYLPGMWETWVQSPGWEDPLEKEMEPHSSTLAWRIPWREQPGRLQSMGSQRVGHNWATSLLHFRMIKPSGMGLLSFWFAREFLSLSDFCHVRIQVISGQ